MYYTATWHFRPIQRRVLYKDDTRTMALKNRAHVAQHGAMAGVLGPDLNSFLTQKSCGVIKGTDRPPSVASHLNNINRVNNDTSTT